MPMTVFIFELVTEFEFVVHCHFFLPILALVKKCKNDFLIFPLFVKCGFPILFHFVPIFFAIWNLDFRPFFCHIEVNT